MSGTRAISTTSRRELSAFFFYFPLGQGAEENSRHSDGNISFFLPGRAKDLSAPLYTKGDEKRILNVRSCKQPIKLL